MTIEVPANLLPSFEKAVEDLARVLGEDPTPATRRLLEMTVLQRGLLAMWNRRGEVDLAVPATARRKRAKSA